jgi:excisionase family DNA binding protein
MNICPRTLDKLIDDGSLACIRIGRRVLIDVQDIRNYIDRNKTCAGNCAAPDKTPSSTPKMAGFQSTVAQRGAA